MTRARKLLTVALVAAALLAGVSLASAASLPLDGGFLTSAVATHPCPGTATATAPTGGGVMYSAASVTVPAACIGKQLAVRMTSGATVVTGTATVVSGATVVSFAPTTYNATSAWTILAIVDGWNLPTTWTGPPAPPAGTCVVTGYQVGDPSKRDPMLTGGTQTCSVTSVVAKNEWTSGGFHYTQFNVTLHNNSTDTIAFELDANLATSPPYLTWSPKSLDLSNLSLVSTCGRMPNVQLTGPTGNFWNSIISPGGDRVLDFAAFEDTSGPTC